MRLPVSSLALSALVVLSSALACTDASLYGRVGQEPALADKLTLTGLLCTDNPATRAFPVRIMFLVDTSGTTFDAAPFGEHVTAIEAVLSQHLPNTNVQVGIIRYADRAESLIAQPLGTQTSGFTRDAAQIDVALASLRNGGGGRDLAAAVSLLRSVVSGDAYLSDRGPLSRTKYVIVHLTTGPPQPAITAARCADLFDTPPDDCERAYLERAMRELSDEVEGLGAAELSFHTVHLEPSRIEGAPCDPRAGNLDCMTAGQACVRTGVRVDTGRCVELCDPAAPACVVDAARTACLEVQNAQGDVVAHCGRGPETACFDGLDNDGDGSTADCADPDYPLDCDGSGGCEADCLGQCRTAVIGADMSLATGGGYQRFSSVDALTFSEIDFRSTQAPFVMKAFIADNRNVIPTESGIVLDSDADGLSDETEWRSSGVDASGQSVTLDPLSADTDGDGFSDKVEHLLRGLSLDPFVTDLPVDCEDPYVDADGDGLMDCEEKLLGSDATLFDTDADGLPDGLELRRGTNLLLDDVLADADQDGVVNGTELRAHTDVTSNDAAVRSGLAYRYSVEPAGTTSDGRACYDVRVSNITLLETLDRGFGPGNNDVDVYFGQVPEGSLDRYGTFSVAQVRVRYIYPDTREPDAAALDLVDEDFLLIGE